MKSLNLATIASNTHLYFNSLIPLLVPVACIVVFDKERFHNAVEIEIFGPFIDTNLAPPKEFSELNYVISIDHVLLAGIVFHVLPRVCPHWYFIC